MNVFFAWRLAPRVEAEGRRASTAATAGVAPGVDRDPPSRRAARPAALDLRHRHARLLRADLGARAVSRRGVRRSTSAPSDRSSPTSACLSFVMRSVLLGPIVDRLGELWTMRLGTLALALGLWLYPAPRFPLDLRAGDPPCADRDGAAVSIHYLTHVPPVRPARAGHHDGRGPDLRRPGARGGPAPRDGGLPAARPRRAVLPGGRLRRSRRGCSRSRYRSIPASPTVPPRRRRASHEHGRAAGTAGARVEVLEALVRASRRGRRESHRSSRPSRPAATRAGSRPHLRRDRVVPADARSASTSGGSASAACWRSASSPC